MKLSITVLGLDLFTIELETDTDENAKGPGDVEASAQSVGFRLPERDGGTPDLVR